MANLILNTGRPQTLGALYAFFLDFSVYLILRSSSFENCNVLFLRFFSFQIISKNCEDGRYYLFAGKVKINVLENERSMLREDDEFNSICQKQLDIL